MEMTLTCMYVLFVKLLSNLSETKIVFVNPVNAV